MAGKIVVFGAGATGRGHVGLLAWQAGFEIDLVDEDSDLIELLQRSGQYKVKVYGQGCNEIIVTGCKYYHSSECEAIASEISDSVLVLTSVFDQNLPDVAKTIAMAASVCRTAGRNTPLNFVACENMQDSSSTLGRYVRTNLSGDDLTYCDDYFGFPDCMISRVVPKPEDDQLVIVAEDYNEWTARADAFKGEKPAALTALELVDNQTARLERKFFIHNGGHAVCGYIGFHRGHEFVHQAVADAVVAEHVLGALDELGQIVQKKHRFSPNSIKEYQQDLCVRGAIPEIRDRILRVVRQPIRKLSSKERLVAPAMLALEYGLPRTWIVKGIVAALKYSHPADEQSLEIEKKLHSKRLGAVLEEVCGIGKDSSLSKEIEQAWNDWSL